MKAGRVAFPEIFGKRTVLQLSFNQNQTRLHMHKHVSFTQTPTFFDVCDVSSPPNNLFCMQNQNYVDTAFLLKHPPTHPPMRSVVFLRQHFPKHSSATTIRYKKIHLVSFVGKFMNKIFSVWFHKHQSQSRIIYTFMTFSTTELFLDLLVPNFILFYI